MRKQSEDFIGTCQCCLGEYKVSDDYKIALHGYTRPGDGRVNNECLGSGYEPFEYDNALTVMVAAAYRRREIADFEYIQKLQNGQVTSLVHRSRKYDYELRKTVEKKEIIHPDHEKWEHTLNLEITTCENDARFQGDMARHLEELIGKWEQKEIIGIDTPPTGKVRFLRDSYDPEQEKRAEEARIKKEERDARPGKLSITFFWESSNLDEVSKEEVDQIKSWASQAFPEGKRLVVRGYEFDLPRDIRRFMNPGRNISVIKLHLDWKYADQVKSIIPEAVTSEEANKKVVYAYNANAQKPWMSPSQILDNQSDQFTP